ncbi:SERAC1 [Verticillium alfalfae VaMs.102]|uniref:GPI inositol-deacylase n=1 Tax=Verticillium alfalfae (strain VaMs.102 / ATCC MYA-4576 / FGSC 10136) TaxID=526221 RepID=C9SP70_VERA1|nr:SERAC1 [Verticillium alfalfae VaMs.102]EEY20585.1 SERAC1 [Verticillium alfalfae VaMs.102]
MQGCRLTHKVACCSTLIGSVGDNVTRSAAEDRTPSAPKVDFIFVHGLGGGSRKTWSKSGLQSHYWPQEWLSKDAAFKHVRVHSYGYDSDYLKGREDCLNVHHIGKSLLAAISTSPFLANSDTRIVAIGHSMGGLVIKKAYLLAKQDITQQSLASRFSTIYFLATPHRGADSATTLRSILKVAYDRAYVGDLERNSSAIQIINDEFRHYSSGLELWSFYETQNMRLFNSLIVDPESAVLGYSGEHQVPMNADHRSICKFDSSMDVTYTTLRNALAMTVDRLATVVPEQKKQEMRNRIRDLKTYLDISDIIDDDFLSVCESRLKNTCQWISTKPKYVIWQDGDSGAERTLWVKGSPGAGKSILAGYVIESLKESGRHCSYFFFKQGDASKASLNRCLRTLAFQMACCDDTVANAILEMQADGVRLDHADEGHLWRILFSPGVLNDKMARHHWVIDAADECSSEPTVFKGLFSKIESTVPLRILITSRDTADVDQRLSSLEFQPLPSLAVTISETRKDSILLIERSTQALRVVKPEDRTALAESILDKSRGSFLWTILVLKELLHCHSTQEVNQVLEDTPRGMESVYKRTLASMSQLTRGRALAKAILMWVTCAVRPLTVGELNDALALDLNDSFPRLEESITALCGQLVVVDMFQRVQMVHETAREFLLSDGLDSEFAIDKTKAHTRMAQMCLRYLAGDEMKPPRTNRRRTFAQVQRSRQEFSLYACAAYSHHLSRADALAPEPLHLASTFFESNVLSWIEAVAEAKNLTQLTQTSGHLATYIRAGKAETTGDNTHLRVLQQWVIDLNRLLALFANALAIAPSAVYSLIPPFCPTSSRVFQTSGQTRRVSVLGAADEHWDDKILGLDFSQGHPSALYHGDEYMAVGLDSGHVMMYHATSFQEYKTIDHGESLKSIGFMAKLNFLITLSMRMLKVWDIRSGNLVKSLKCPPRPVEMTWDEGTLYVASERNYVASWDLGHNDIQEEPTQSPWSNTPGLHRAPPRQVPRALALSVNHQMIAASYINHPITLWDMNEDAYAGSCGKSNGIGETSTCPVDAMIFNPDPDILLLAVSYFDGELAIIDPFANQQLGCIRKHCQSLAASPDGRLLAAGDTQGIIDLFEFKTLKLLYRLKGYNSYIKQLSFARDGLLLSDIRSSQCTIWEPATVLQDISKNDSALGTTLSSAERPDSATEGRITSLVPHPSGEIIFAGKNNGEVMVYDRTKAEPLCMLCDHQASIRLIAWCNQLEALLSVDVANCILLHRFTKAAGDTWTGPATPMLEFRVQSGGWAIVDVLVGETANKLLVLTREASHLISLDGGKQESVRPHQMILGARKWLPHPQSQQHLICIEATELGIYRWADLSLVNSLPLQLGESTLELRNVMTCGLDRSSLVLLELAHEDNRSRTQDVVAIVSQSLSIEAFGQSDPPLRPKILSPAFNIAHIIGFDRRGNLIYLDHASWVCSTIIDGSLLPGTYDQELPPPDVTRHFFVPYDWFSGDSVPISAMVQGDVLLTRGGKLAIVRGGFEHSV